MKSQSIYKHSVWPLVLIISIGGIFYPKLGLLMYPMMLTIMVLGFWAGRFWCGNFCPRGAFLDIPVRKIGKLKTIKNIFRNFYVRLGVLVVLMSMFSKNVYFAIQAYGTTQFLDKLGMAGVMMCIVTTTIALLFAFTVNPRTWCTFCPMGTVQKALHSIKKAIFKTNKLNPNVTLTCPEDCTKCNLCTNACPMQIIDHSNNSNQVMSNDCIKCGVCVDTCNSKLLSFTTEKPKPRIQL